MTASAHRYYSYICAETDRPLEAEFHRLEARVCELDDELRTLSIFNPRYWVVAYQLNQAEYRAHLAWCELWGEV